MLKKEEFNKTENPKKNNDKAFKIAIALVLFLLGIFALVSLLSGEQSWFSGIFYSFFGYASLFTAVTKPMKKLMTKTQHNLLKSRQLVETIIGKIKYRKNPVTSLARSLKGYQYRIIFSLLAVVMLELPGF